jgi:hypothetical protein
MSSPRSAFALALIALSPFVALSPLVACGGNEPAPAVPPPTTAPSGSASGVVLVSNSNPSDTGAPADSASAATAPAPSPSALAAILTVDAAQVAAIAAAASTAAAPKMQTASAAKDMAKALTGVAAKMAPGMKPDGSIATGTLKEGDHLAWTLSLAPGKCYAIVGYSPSGEIADLDLRLLAPPFYASITGEDETDDNTPVVGGGPNPMCPVVASPLPYKLDITSQKGSGHAAVQLFAKTK